MRRPRSLAPEETALWRKVASTVRPLVPPRHGEGDQPQAGGGAPSSGHDVRPGTTDFSAVLDQAQAGGGAPSFQAPGPTKLDLPLHHAAHGPPPRIGEESRASPRSLDRHGLDAGWERRLARGLIEPDFTLDLHGATLDAAYARLGHGLNQARAMGARVVLLITGRPRPVEAADRGRMRGAIRAKIADWIAAGEHGAAIAAIRPAHRRHGGPGALYLVLRRRRG